MSSLDSSFAEHFARLRAGGREGEADFLNQYMKKLLGLARSRLHAKVLARMDPEDVVQSAMLSFATRHTGEVDLQAENGLWGKLLEVTLRHCNKWNRRVQRERTRIVPLQPSKDETDTGFEPADDEPTPAEAAALADLVEWLMRGLEMPDERKMVMLRLQGCPIAEIAGKVLTSERTVARTIKEVKERLARRLEQFQENK